MLSNRVVVGAAFAAGILAGGLALVSSAAESATLTVIVDQPGARISPRLWGIFFEDINCSADGGIYAELVRNRSLEDTDKPEHWTTVGSGSAKVTLAVDGQRPVSPKNPHSLKVTVIDTGTSRAGVANGGYWGMGLQQGATYRLSLCARGGEGLGGPLTVALESSDGATYAQAALPQLTADWKNYQLTLTASATDPQARLTITTDKPGTFWVDMVSLFPQKTWKNRPNGLRPDLAEMLAGLKPAFVRFPGGCWVEGDTMKFAYRWKQTIGDIAERRTQFNIWNYYATHGVGFHEYLQMCEDLGAEPLFVINCGMSHRENIPMDQMQEFVQDALDAIEYCNGPVDSHWGALRAKAGHPDPFNLQYMEIGNENGGPAYQERYALLHDAIKAKYPNLTLIADVPTHQRRADVVDEHYYSSPEFFIQQAARYDKYDRTGPKIYVGEYAVTQNCGKGNLRGALGEAAFMTGMERNSDVVVMASYAPLLVNVHHRGWNPDLIAYDSTRVYAIPSYYVQQMFSQHRGDMVLPTTVQSPIVDAGPVAGAIGVGTWATQAEFKDLKVTQGDKVLFQSDFTQGPAGWKLVRGDWKVQDGALRQSSLDIDLRAIAGDKNWSNYTYTLKARKLSGAEGFLIMFRVRDDRAKAWWNLGGWGNNRHAVEMGGIIGTGVPGKIETGQWYDVRIELQGANIRCFLDGKLIHDIVYPAFASLHAAASRVQATGDVILKVVNVSAGDQSTDVELRGITGVQPSAAISVLTSANPEDENSLEEPRKVAPVERTITFAGPRFRHTFPAHSVSVLRLKTRP